MTANCIYIPLGFGAVLEVCTLPPPPLPPVPAPDLPDTPIPDLPPLTGPGRAEATTPGARVEDRALERTRDDVCTTGCQACIAAASGYPDWVSYHNNKDQPVAGTASRGYAYQAFVSGLPHEPENRRNMEWQWAAYSWDGIEVLTCTMLEAKYGYDDFFVPYNHSGPIFASGKEVIAGFVFNKMIRQLGQQVSRVAPFAPEVKLKWVFSHQNPMTWLMTLANQRSLSSFSTEYRPFDQ
jgi:hypothetical protein